MSVARELAALPKLTISQLRDKYAEVFGEATKTGNKTWLLRRVAWRLQAQAEGDLSERARRRAAELADDADLRLSPPREKATLPMPSSVRSPDGEADPRLPAPGSVIMRRYRNTDVQVQVLRQGFAYEGELYPSLSAVAKAITGQHCNGFLFFGLTNKGGKA